MSGGGGGGAAEADELPETASITSYGRSVRFGFESKLGEFRIEGNRECIHCAQA